MYSKELLDFVNSPDTVDFIARATEAFFDYIRSEAEVVITQMLSGRYVLGYIHKDNYTDLIHALGPGYISSASVILGPLDRPALESAGIIRVHNQPYLNLKGRGVLVGIVDTGIDFTQEPFLYEDGTSKIQYIYDQTAEGPPPDGFFIGHEYTNEEINAALQSDHPHEVLPHTDESGHGTFIASVTAGRETEEFIGAAPDAEIIAVKLRTAKPFYREKFCVPDDQKFAYGSNSVMVGVEYILQKARELKRPVVLCIGLGTNFGGHDGFSIFEEYLSGVSNLKGVCLCTAVGNESQERHHASGKLAAAEDTQNLDIKVGNNAGDIFLSIWNTVADRLSVSVRSPSGELVGRIPPKPGVLTNEKLILEPTRVQIEYYLPMEGSSGQLTVIRILGATPGIWTVTIHGDIVLDGTYHAWLPLTGFVSPEVEFLSAEPYYTITIPSTAVGAISCGAYDSLNQSLYLKSSWGPARSKAMMPDLVAPGANIGGYFPYGFGTRSGTSAAMAVTAGACALLLQWGLVEGNDIAMCTYQIRAYLIRGCDRNAAMTYPNKQWGYGILDLMQSFHLMREL